jgi:ribose transport system substrate-binding protein
MPKAFAARQRTLGFESWIKDNAPGIEIVEKQNADWDREKQKIQLKLGSKNILI